GGGRGWGGWGGGGGGGAGGEGGVGRGERWGGRGWRRRGEAWLEMRGSRSAGAALHVGSWLCDSADSCTSAGLSRPASVPRRLACCSSRGSPAAQSGELILAAVTVRVLSCLLQPNHSCRDVRVRVGLLTPKRACRPIVGAITVATGWPFAIY